MPKFCLTDDQKCELESRHKCARDSHESDRLKAILLSSEGWSLVDIAQALRKHESTIQRHIDDYLQHQKLKPNSGGSVSRLDVSQTEELIVHLDKKVYQHIYQIVAYIEQRWSVTYSIPGLNKMASQKWFQLQTA